MDRILEVGAGNPRSKALCVHGPESGDTQSLTYGEFLASAAGLAKHLLQWRMHASQPLRVGLIAGNSPGWAIADLALLLAGITEVPIPLAFSREQAGNLLDACDAYLVDGRGVKALKHWGITLDTDAPVLELKLDELIRNGSGLTQLPVFDPECDWICKIIHTSGTTSNPKGVKIRYLGLSALIDSLMCCVGPHDYQRYLSLVPLSLLIEQVTALYLPACSGGHTVFLPPSIPLLGSRGVNARDYLGYIRRNRPSALTLTPALVESLASEVANSSESGEALMRRVFDQPKSPSIACGGAPTDPGLLAALAERGIPVYEGYGLSENSSVVCWNHNGAYRAGTVGKPLSHVSIRLSEAGELLVRSSSLFAGYTTEDPSSCVLDEDGWLHTGDLAEIDADGFVRIIGRSKNIIITANGRNLCPEWVESSYRSLEFVEHAVLFGNGLERVHGFFVIDDELPPAIAEHELRQYGKCRLSEVERVETFHFIARSDPAVQRFFTVTGRPQRTKLWSYLKSQMENRREAKC
nr:AMP-binding protein [Microbulbifer rhizosphaerae]